MTCSPLLIWIEAIDFVQQKLQRMGTRSDLNNLPRCQIVAIPAPCITAGTVSATLRRAGWRYAVAVEASWRNRGSDSGVRIKTTQAMTPDAHAKQRKQKSKNVGSGEEEERRISQPQLNTSLLPPIST
jgi:hypothetical protein